MLIIKNHYFPNFLLNFRSIPDFHDTIRNLWISPTHKNEDSFQRRQGNQSGKNDILIIKSLHKTNLIPSKTVSPSDAHFYNFSNSSTTRKMYP